MMTEVKTHVIDGVTYVEVNRKAEIGEKAIVINAQDLNRVGYSNGHIFTVSARWQSGEGETGVDDDEYVTYYDSEYHVLEPAVTVDSSQASEQVIEMFAALSRKIVSLEQQLRDTQCNVERHAEELENAKHVASKALRVTGDHGVWLISNAERLDKAEELVEMLIDDDRTQPTVRDALQNTIEVLCAHIAKQGDERR